MFCPNDLLRAIPATRSRTSKVFLILFSGVTNFHHHTRLCCACSISCCKSNWLVKCLVLFECCYFMEILYAYFNTLIRVQFADISSFAQIKQLTTIVLYRYTLLSTNSNSRFLHQNSVGTILFYE
jgi:hypothetical protein